MRLGAIDLCAGALALVAASATGAFGSEIAVSTPGKTVVQDGAGDLLLANCVGARAAMPCTLPVGASRSAPAWLDIASAEIEQIDAATVEISTAVRAPVPAERPPVPVLIYYWQFQDGCTVSSPTDKDGVNVFWNGREWSAHWFVVGGCNPRRVSIGEAVPFRFEGARVTVRVRLADLITRGGAPLEWFAGTRLLGFSHPIFTRTLPVDVAPDVVALDPRDPETPVHPEPPARWSPR